MDFFIFYFPSTILKTRLVIPTNESVICVHIVWEIALIMLMLANSLSRLAQLFCKIPIAVVIVIIIITSTVTRRMEILLSVDDKIGQIFQHRSVRKARVK